MSRRIQRRHHVARIVTGTVGHIILECGISGQRNSDEVHQVVAGEGHGQCECTRKNEDLKDIDLKHI